MFNIFGAKDKSIIDASTLQRILDEVLSTRLERLGLKKVTNYTWHEPGTKEIRHGFSYSHLKGAAGTFTWGANLDFLPTVSGSSIVYHKSPKKYLHHLFEWTDEYAMSFAGGEIAGGITTHWGKTDARKSILKLFDRYESKIEDWFNKASSIQNILEIAECQASTPKLYRHHSPDPNYILAFLYAKANEVDKAMKLFDSLSNVTLDKHEHLREKLRIKLQLLPSRLEEIERNNP
jgi:hypothetical protein